MSERRFVAEGPQAVREALTVRGCVVDVLATYDASDRHRDLTEAARAAGADWHLVDEAALTILTDTVTPQGLAAVCNFVDTDLDDLLSTRPEPPGLVAMCASVRDPGNAGTVIRCADAVGAQAVILAGTSVDPYNGKAVRASVGSLFHLPIAFRVTVPESVDAVRRTGLGVLAADAAGSLTLDDALDSGLLSRPTAWMFGNEAWGMAAEDAALADHVVQVPIYGRAESLNLATAAAVCLYASARAQRRRSFSADPRSQSDRRRLS